MFPFSKTTSLGCDAKTLRQEQQENPKSALSRLGLWLAKCSAEGSVSRQEVVSTVPVAMLGIERGHVVLDLCAAPGSKTLQALELAGDGAVIANELSASRACVLARRCSSQPAAAAVAVVQHKAQLFPTPALYDRIICDVPCSGDGTYEEASWKVEKLEPTFGPRAPFKAAADCFESNGFAESGWLDDFWLHVSQTLLYFLVSIMFIHVLSFHGVLVCWQLHSWESWRTVVPTEADSDMDHLQWLSNTRLPSGTGWALRKWNKCEHAIARIIMHLCATYFAWRLWPLSYWQLLVLPALR